MAVDSSRELAEQLDRREWINDDVVDPGRFARATDWLVEVKWFALTVAISITQMDTYAPCKASSSSTTSAGNAQAALMISD